MRHAKPVRIENRTYRGGVNAVVETAPTPINRDRHSRLERKAELTWAGKPHPYVKIKGLC